MNDELIKSSLNKRPAAAFNSSKGRRIMHNFLVPSSCLSIARLVLVMASVHSVALSQIDPFAPPQYTPIKLKLKYLTHDRVTIYPIQHKMPRIASQRQIVLPHCSEIFFEPNLTSVRYFNARNLVFDTSGAITNRFVIIDYRGDNRTFSNGGDDILLKFASKDDPIHVSAALDTTKAGFWINPNDTAITYRDLSYVLDGQTITESHEIRHAINVQLILEQGVRGCD